MKWLKKLPQWVWLSVVMLVMFIGVITLGLWNRSDIEQQKRDGRAPISIAQPLTPVVNGEDGKNGKSAFEIWLDLGNEGNETDFILAIRGADGVDGIDGEDGTAGDDGADGIDGVNGNDGLTGPTGPIGPQGPVGLTGATGPAGEKAPRLVISCVIRWDETIPSVTRYWEAMKYENEPDSAYVNFKRIRSEDRTLYADCKDLRV